MTSSSTVLPTHFTFWRQFCKIPSLEFTRLSRFVTNVKVSSRQSYKNRIWRTRSRSSTFNLECTDIVMYRHCDMLMISAMSVCNSVITNSDKFYFTRSNLLCSCTFSFSAKIGQIVNLWGKWHVNNEQWIRLCLADGWTAGLNSEASKKNLTHCNGGECDVFFETHSTVTRSFDLRVRYGVASTHTRAHEKHLPLILNFITN